MHIPSKIMMLIAPTTIAAISPPVRYPAFKNPSVITNPSEELASETMLAVTLRVPELNTAPN